MSERVYEFERDKAGPYRIILIEILNKVYLVCYVGQLDPERKDGIAVKYAVKNKNNDPIFKECTDKSLKSKNADKKKGNEPDYDYWNNAGPKHGLLVKYLSGGNFSFSASYLKES
uniref:Uncharacterized protein n=1 Tax=Meloidogyne enterolobii TaxID=390850 RepID=A0A6V7XVV4_MELEN|nr:unnamed protein product [Meloidogyne enterolobii]